MADRGKNQDGPKLGSSRPKSKTRKQRAELTEAQDDPELISDPNASHKIPPKRRVKSKGRKSATLSNGKTLDDDDGVDNPSFNQNELNNLATSGTPRRKKKTVTGGSTRSLQSGRSLPLSGGDVSEPSSERPRKKRRSRKPVGSSASTKIESLGVDLADIADDIIENGTDAETDSVTQAQAPHKMHMKSQPIGKHYIEQTDYFQAVKAPFCLPQQSNSPSLVDRLKKHLHLTGEFDNINDSSINRKVSEQLTTLQFLRSKFGLPTPSTASMHLEEPPSSSVHKDAGGFKSAEQKVMDEMYSEEKRRQQGEYGDEEQAFPVQMSSIAFALASIQLFKTISHFCMGILAGLAIWQTVYAFTFTDPAGDNSEFYEVYSKLSVTINCVFYVVLVFCTVATFDRYDVSKVTRPCLSKAFTLQSGAVAALLYTAALCVNVSMAPMDDRLGVKTNVTTDALRDFADRDKEATFLKIWRALAVVRAVLVGLAWFIVSLRPGTDRLTKNLSQTEVTWGDKEDTNISMSVKRNNGITRA